jgi:hypothetical protein
VFPKQLTFWLAVAGVSLITPIVFNLAADRLPIPGLQTINSYATRRNG